MLGVTLGSLYVHTSVYVPALLKNLRGMSCSGAYWSWVVVGFGVGMEAFGWSLIPNVLCSQEFYGFLRFWA